MMKMRNDCCFTHTSTFKRGVGELFGLAGRSFRMFVLYAFILRPMSHT